MKPCETSARKGEQQVSCRVPMPPASQRLGEHGGKKGLQNPNHKGPSVGTQAVLPGADSCTHGAIHSTEEFSFHLLRGFNNIEQMKDVSHPGI